MRFKFAPLKASFAATSIIGFLVSVILIPKFSETWAFTFAIVFLIMFIAAMLSMTKAPIPEELHEEESKK